MDVAHMLASMAVAGPSDDAFGGPSPPVSESGMATKVSWSSGFYPGWNTLDACLCLLTVLRAL